MGIWRAMPAEMIVGATCAPRPAHTHPAEPNQPPATPRNPRVTRQNSGQQTRSVEKEKNNEGLG